MNRVADEGTRWLSRILSEVLSDIGLNERIVKIKRNCTLLQESVSNIACMLRKLPTFIHRFGSQSEVATTIGLESDVDIVICNYISRVIQDLTEWRPGVENLLMVRDENTSPGYCLLQQLRLDIPQAETRVPGIDNMYTLDDKKRILHVNTMAHKMFAAPGFQINGPAFTKTNTAYIDDLDMVIAYHCASWPYEGREWLERQCVGDWPSMELKKLAASHGCFVVPVSSKLNGLNDVEWRISTSMAERLMMFSLSITQVRCYVMLKMIKKTYFTINGESCITSFMCKCVLFYCIETTRSCFWRKDNLFLCVMRCLERLRECLIGLNCPHLIIRENNLMTGRINAQQQCDLLHVLDMLNANIDMILNIKIDDLGKRIQEKLTKTCLYDSTFFQDLINDISIVTCEHLYLQQLTIGEYNNVLLEHRDKRLSETLQTIVERTQELRRQCHMLSDIEQEAFQHLKPLLSSCVGSLLAAGSVFTHQTVSQEAIRKLTSGFESDISSSRLKLASAFYCAGDFNSAEITLKETELLYTNCVQPLCVCYESPDPCAQWYLQAYINIDSINKTLAHCVRYLRCEAPIIPKELRYELFRSTEEGIQNRLKYNTEWMDMAVVDSLPYLYFLQYKVYKGLGHQRDQRKAMESLLEVTQNKPCLSHRETAWNLLGQCYEQENNSTKAQWCYEKSLQVRPDNNAANFHKECILKT